MHHISIIMPCYNCAATLPRAIQSVVTQNDWFELIIVDDASTDASPSIIEAYTQKYPQIKSVRLPQNSGAALARNIGRAYAQGDILAFLDADDEHASGYYNFARETFAHLPDIAALRVGTEFANFPDDLLTPAYEEKRNILLNTFIPNMMVRSVCFDLLGGFPMHPVIRRDGGEDGVFSQILQQCFTVGTFYQTNYLVHYWHKGVHAEKFLKQDITVQDNQNAEVVQVSWALIDKKTQQIAWAQQNLNQGAKGFKPLMVAYQ